MRRVQLTPASGNNPGKKEDGPPRGARGGGLLGGLGKPATKPSSAASSLFNVPAKRRVGGGDGDDDGIHGSTAPQPTVATRQHDPRDTAFSSEMNGAETPLAVVSEVQKKKAEEGCVDLAGAVAIVKEVCEALNADTMELADADARLNSLSTAALLAAAPFEHPTDREDVFEASRKLWNLCVARTNALITDVHHTAANERDGFPLAQSEALAEKKEAAAVVTRLREHCCNLLEASLCDPAVGPGQQQAAAAMRAQDAHVGLTFHSKTAMLLHEESQFDHAEKMFERVSRFTRVLQSWLIASRRHDNEGGMDVNMIQNLDAAQIISQIFDMDVTRASNAWHLGKLDQCHNLLGESFALATTAGLNEKKTKAMLSKLVSIRLQIGKLALKRANAKDGEDFTKDAKHAVMILEGAYDVLTNQLPASWMSAEARAGRKDGESSDDDPLTRMEHDAGVEGDEDSESTRQNDAVHIEVLRYLACASVYAEKYAASSSCVDLIRTSIEQKDPSRMTPHLDFTLNYISFLGQIGTDAVLDATRTIERMIQSPTARFKTCNQALIKLVQAAPHSCAEAVRMYILLVSDTVSESSDSESGTTSVARASVSLLEALLEAAKHNCSDDAVDATLSLLSDETINSGLVACQAEYRQAYNLIFNAGTLMFTRGDHFHLATKLFQCSVDFQANSTSHPRDSSGSDPGRAKLLRLQARCQIESGLVDDALACVATVEALESPPSPATLLLKLKALLRADGQNDADVLESLNQLHTFRDPDYLIAAVLETEESGNHEASAACFLKLHNLIIQQQQHDASGDDPLRRLEMLVYRLAVFHTIEAHNKKEATATEEGLAVVIGKLLQKMLERLKKVKKDSLTAADGEYFAGIVGFFFQTFAPA